MTNFDSFTPEQIYHLENSLLSNVIFNLRALNTYSVKLKDEITKVNVKNKFIKNLTGLLSNIESEENDSGADIKIAAINKSDLLDYIDEDGNLDKNSLLDGAKELRDEKINEMLTKVYEIHCEITSKYEEIEIVSKLYSQMYNSLFSLFDYKYLNVKEIENEPTMIEKREEYHEQLEKLSKKEYVDDLYEKYKKVVHESII